MSGFPFGCWQSDFGVRLHYSSLKRVSAKVKTSGRNLILEELFTVNVSVPFDPDDLVIWIEVHQFIRRKKTLFSRAEITGKILLI